MSNSPTSLADNLSEGLHKDKCKNCEPVLKCVTATENTLTFKCIACNKNYEKKVWQRSHQYIP